MVHFYQDNISTLENQGDFIVLLLDSAIVYMRQAIKVLEENNYEGTDNYLNKAKYIIDKLNEVLDMETGGKLAINLRRLYCFMNSQLTQANIECEPQMIHDVITLIEILAKKCKATASS